MQRARRSYGYAANGNLIDKSDVGTYSYTDPKHPHAVTNVPGVSYGYDAVGNQITRPGLVSISVHAVRFAENDHARRPNDRRLGMTATNNVFAKRRRQAKRLRGRHLRAGHERRGQRISVYVFSPERVIAIVTRGGNEPGTKYLYTDHLGSIETVTDEAGKLLKNAAMMFSGRGVIRNGASLAGFYRAKQRKVLRGTTRKTNSAS